MRAVTLAICILATCLAASMLARDEPSSTVGSTSWSGKAAAAYLDGPGRAESRAMSRTVGLAYATESMRLTTRLMQVASWLLLQRAVNEGELTPNQALTERHRVKLARQDLACAPEIFEQLPATLRALSRRSLRIQERVIHLDQSLVRACAPEASCCGSAVAAQVERLRAAFSN